MLIVASCGTAATKHADGRATTCPATRRVPLPIAPVTEEHRTLQYWAALGNADLDAPLLSKPEIEAHNRALMANDMGQLDLLETIEESLLLKIPQRSTRLSSTKSCDGKVSQRPKSRVRPQTLQPPILIAHASTDHSQSRRVGHATLRANTPGHVHRPGRHRLRSKYMQYLEAKRAHSSLGDVAQWNAARALTLRAGLDRERCPSFPSSFAKKKRKPRAKHFPSRGTMYSKKPFHCWGRPMGGADVKAVATARVSCSMYSKNLAFDCHATASRNRWRERFLSTQRTWRTTKTSWP